MGHGSYSTTDRGVRAMSAGYYTKSSNEIFAHSVNDKMSPFNMTVREARDSKDHPATLAIMLALDLTGSMGSVPSYLIKDGLPTLMSNIIQKGQKDAALLFLGVGDHECDKEPLQVGQFEASDALLDIWLTSTYLEGGGGGNEGESYLLAWYVAAFKTTIDCFEKRNQKGFLFTIGDEPTLKSVPIDKMQKIIGEGQFENFTANQLLEKAREKYHVYHIHVKETRAGQIHETVKGWKQLMGQDLLTVEAHEDIPNLIADTISKVMGSHKDSKFANISVNPAKPTLDDDFVL